MELEQSMVNGKKWVHLSIDPGSNKMGLAVFSTAGKLLGTFTATATKGAAAQRLLQIREEFYRWFNMFYPDVYIAATIMEHLPPSQKTPSLPISPGCVVAFERNFSPLKPECAVPTNTWKSVMRQLGCNAPDPKGTGIFKSISHWGFEFPKTPDEADAIAIYLAYLWETRGYCWLAPDLRVRRIL